MPTIHKGMAPQRPSERTGVQPCIITEGEGRNLA